MFYKTRLNNTWIKEIILYTKTAYIKQYIKGGGKDGGERGEGEREHRGRINRFRYVCMYSGDKFIVPVFPVMP